MQHLCIRTLRPSHTESFEDAWTFSLEASRASLFHRQVLEKQLKILVTSSPSLQKESESANLELFSSKTYKESSAVAPVTESQFYNMSSEHWKRWVTEQRQEYSQRKKSAHLTNAKESLSWGIPNTMDVLPSRSYEAMKRQATNGQRKNRQRPGNLREQVDPLMCQAYKDAQKEANQKNWPTARTSDAEGGRIETEMTDEGFKSKRHRSNQTFGAKLRDAVETHEEKKNWATPQTFDSNNLVRTPEKLAQTRAEKNAGCMNLREQVHYPDMDHSRKAAQNWPTPATRDYKGANSVQHVLGETASKRGHMGQLPNAVLKDGLQDQPKLSTNGKNRESWPTPRETMSRDATHDRGKGNLGEVAQGKLNPNWVEQLMGITVGWTDLGYWETESFQQQQLKHSSHLSKE
jgi:hypothetical protein